LIHQTCHYLQSVRPDGLHLGLYTNDETLLALATLSPFDLDHIDPHLPHEIKDKNILVLSRFITFDWSPQNTASYTLGQVARWLRRERPGISAIFTYLDPNAGFDGSIYKAVNAQLLGYEHKKRYLYLDRDYVTDREMIRRFGTAKIDKVRTFVGDRIESSSVPLESLRMYLIPVSHVTDNSESWDIKVDPPESLVG
jgi:hypothetical protein